MKKKAAFLFLFCELFKKFFFDFFDLQGGKIFTRGWVPEELGFRVRVGEIQ